MRSLLVSLSLLISLLPSQPLNARTSQTPSDREPDDGSVVCPPAVYAIAPDICLPLGPSTYLAQLATNGIPYPIPPLPAYRPDPAFNEIPYHYFKVTEAGGPLYSSLDAVASHQPSKVLYPSNHLYVSYLGEAVPVGQDAYYQLRSGYWVRAEGGRQGVYDPPFQGLLFSSAPRNAFGWILGEIQSRTAPGVNAPESGVTYYRFQVVQIYSAQKVDNLTWDLVGPGEWVDARQIARVDPLAGPPAGVAGGRWISVNLFEQTVTIHSDNRLVFATMASTGIDHFWTRPGLFQIKNKLETETMSNSDPEDFYYLEDVPWTMYFDEGRALHGAYWHNRFGYRQSHGCVNLSIGDAHWIYDWAEVGDFVYVYDPSGQTPTDPVSYGAGAP